MDILELLIQAIVQGVLEWLPVSSSGFIALITLLLDEETLSRAIDIALFMHLGSGLAALILLRTDVLLHLRSVIHRRRGRQKHEEVYIDPVIYVAGIFVSGFTGLLVYNWLTSLIVDPSPASALIGSSLIVTALITCRKGSFYSRDRIGKVDQFILYVLQGIAVVPGISRSGIVLAYLSFRKVKPDLAFRINLFIGIPVLLIAGIYGLVNVINIIDPLTALIVELIVFGISFTIARCLLDYLKKIKAWLFPLVVGVLLLVSSMMELIR